MRLVGRERRRRRIRKKIFGTKKRPRLCVFRSNQHIYAMIIDDSQQTRLCSTSSVGDKSLKEKKKTVAALELGEKIGKLAIQHSIKEVAFDRAGYKYHGRVKAVAEGARKAGLEF